MNRKLVNGLLLLTLVTGGTSLFTSCKDTDEEYRNETLKNQNEILDVYKEIYEATKKLPQEVQDMINKELYVTDADGDLVLENGQPIPIYAKKGDVDDLKEKLYGPNGNDGLLNQVASMNQTLFGADGNSGLLSDLANLNDKISGTDGINDQIAEIERRLGLLEAQEPGTGCDCDAETLETLKKLLLGEDGESGLLKEFNDLKDDINGPDGIKAKVNQLRTDLTDVQTLLDSLAEQVKALIDDVNTRIDELITSIELHQTWNPIFGSFNYPVGLSSSIVGSYYGISEEKVAFPLQVREYPNADVAGSESALLRIDAAALANLISNLGDAKEVIEAGVPYYNDADNNMGQIYLTVNPFNPSAERNVTYSLVNSQDELAPAVTIDVKDTDEVLTFGYKSTSTRAANGFYRAEVKTTDPTAEGLKIEVSGELKSAMKDALKDRSKTDFATLAKILYDEMQKGLTAYAVKAEWSHTGKELTKSADGTKYEVKDKDEVTYSVISKYDIAAATFRPLGYGSLDYNIYDKFHFPTYNGTIKDAIDKVFDEFNFTFNIEGLSEVKPLDPTELKIDLSKTKIEFSGTEIKIDLSGTPITVGDVAGQINDNTYIYLTYDANSGTIDGEENKNAEALKPLLDTIASKVNELLDNDDQNNPGIQQKLNELLEGTVAAKVNEMVSKINNMLVGDGTPGSGINAQINQNIEKIIANIKSTIVGKLGKAESLLNKYNKIANKLNEWLKDPNHFLQVLATYQDANKDLHTLSTSLYMPSFFQKAALEVYVSSYTNEIIAPSYKKYVAVSNVYDKNTHKQIADFATEVNKVNSANEFLNTLVPGHVQSVALDASSLNSDYIYELVYTSLDYRGKTSSQLYYITVGK